MIYPKLLAYISLASFCLAAPIQDTPDTSLIPRCQHGSVDDRRRGQHESLDDAPIIVTRSNINGNTPVFKAKDDGYGNPPHADPPLSARGDDSGNLADTADNVGSVRARTDSGG